MPKSTINDLTDAFDTRLQAMQKRRAPKAEEDAAIMIYERMRTARAICQALLSAPASEASVVALACELGREVQQSQTSSSRA